MVSGNALGKTRGPAGVEHVGEIFHGVHFRWVFQGCMAQQGFKIVNTRGLLNFSGGNFVEQYPQITFPGRQKVNQVGDDNLFKIRVFHHILDIAEVGIHADDGPGA